jgi:hypothetical protein
MKYRIKQVEPGGVGFSSYQSTLITLEVIYP